MTQPVAGVRPPRLAPGSVERIGLLARLAEARQRSCLLVLGPAGSGKTSLALQWRGRAMAFGHDVAWLTVQAGDDAQALLAQLLDALDAVDPLLGREARLLFNRGADGPANDAIAIALLRALMARERPLLLVLDDWQNVGDARAHAVLQTLLDFAPPSLRLMIVSRSVPPLALARLRAQAALLEIGPADLRFTLDEVRDFMATRIPGAAAADARRLLDLTDGWAAGLQLVALEPGAAPAPVQNAHDFAAYFNREVLCRVDEAALEAMTRLAAARAFNAAVAATLAGETAGPALLGRLQRENLFLMPQEGSGREGWYRFHPLFRDLLLERFETLPRDERRRTHAVLAQCFGRLRLLREAVHHGVAAGDLEQAADWVEHWARELFLNGELQALVRAVSELPRAVLNARASLLLWVGWSQLCYHRFAACHDTLAALEAQVPEGDAGGRAHCALLAFSLALQEDDLAAAQRLLPGMESLPQGRDAVLVGGRRNLLGWMHVHLGQYPQARAALQGPAPLREDGSPLQDSPFGECMAEALLGLAWLYENDIRHAEPVLREALAHAERSLGPFSEPACNAAAYLAAALYESNDLDGLELLLDGRMDTLERVVLPDALLAASLAQARLRLFEGNPREALEGLERLEEVAQRRGLDRLLAFALHERVRCLLRIADTPGRAQALHALQALAARHAGSPLPLGRRVAGLAAHAAALVAAAAHDDRAALAALDGPAGAREAMAQRRDQCPALALRAILLARMGQQDAALTALRDALMQGQQMGLVRSLLDLGEELLALATLCAHAHGAADPRLPFYVDHLQRQARVHRPQAALREAILPREPLSDRETEIVRALGHSMSNKRIAQVLGVSPETVKWHLRNVYAKLGVIGRDDAVARARDMGLLG